MVAVVELVIAGVMPLVVATATVSAQLADNPVPARRATVKLSGVAAVERVMVEVPGVTVQFVPATVAVTVAGRVVGLAGIVESAAVVVQTELAAPAVAGFGVQVGVGRRIVGGADTDRVTVNVATSGPLTPLTVTTPVIGPTVVGMAAALTAISPECWRHWSIPGWEPATARWR